MNIRLRPVTLSDLTFERELYASTREDLRMLDLDPGTIDSLIQMQFDSQRSSYEASFPDADRYIVEYKKTPIGRLIVGRREGELHGIDIALLPEYRNQGIGTQIIQDLFAEAEKNGQQMRIHVMELNRARRLYRRLGFRETGSEIANHVEMIFDPASVQNSNPITDDGAEG